MSEKTGESVSGVARVEAPDGSSFDMLKHAPEGAAESRGNALVEMRKVVAEREPRISKYLGPYSRVSAEYAMSAAILHSERLDVKADLTRISLSSHLAESNRWGAVRVLAYADAARLPLPEYDDRWVADQYDAALSSGDVSGAWRIAETMLQKGDKVVKSGPGPEDTESPAYRAWADREKRAFEQYTEEVLQRGEQLSDEHTRWELRTIFDEMRYRQDGGFSSDTPSELSRQVAERMIESYLSTPGREWVALVKATEANMPDDYLAELRRRVAPTAVDRAKKLLAGVRAGVDKLLRSE